MVDDKQGFISQSEKVSIVLPTYNHLEFLPTAIHGILKQTYNDFELIVVNDGSIDGTREYLDSLKEPRIRVIHQDNKRLPEALNTGFRAAHGELLTWISADNYCAPIFLEALVGALDAYPNAGFAYSAHAWIDNNEQVTGVHKDQDVSYHRLLVGNPGIASFMYRRICHEKVGWYDRDLEGAEDWDYWLRIIEQFQTVYIPEVLYYYRRHKEAMTERIPEKVLRASKQTFHKAINRRNNNLDITVLYPTLHMCRDVEAAKFYAYFDLGTTLLRSRFASIELASGALENALSITPSSVEVVSNLTVAYARSGQWERALPLLRKMVKKLQNREVLQVCHSIIEAYRRGDPQLLSNVPLFIPDKKAIELFQLEQRQKRIFSLAHYNRDSSAKEFSKNEFAALDRAKEIDRRGEDSREETKGKIIKENKRKILLVVHSFPPDWYAGVENYTYSFAKILIAKGFDVSVLYPKSDPHIQLPILKEDSHDGIKIYKLVSKSFYNLAFHVENNKVEELFENLLDEQRFNLIHFQHIKGFPFSLLNIGKDKGTPVCLTLHDFWFICHKTHLYLDRTGELCTGPDSVEKCAKCTLSNAQKTPDSKQAAFLHHMIAHRQEYVRQLLQKIDIVAAPSRYLKEKFTSCGFGKDKIALCPLGIKPVKVNDRKRTDGVIIGFLGAIHELKNTVFLAEAFKRIRGNTRLIFWGDGKPNEIAKLQSAIEGQRHIEYKGSYSPEQLPEILSGVDIVVVPSLIENYPLVVRESLSAGVPVIASNVGGIPEIVSHMKNGMLFDPNSKDKLVESIQEIVDNPSTIEQLKKGITHIKTIKEDVEEWIDRYNELVEGQDKRAKCSIIIPVFNNAEYTKQCLKALIENAPNSPYEVIIVDNGSTDSTEEVLKCLRGSVKIISNSENLGFAKACNQGAAAADGNYLVFLNNDTKVQPGWLRELVKVLENDPGVGAVGSKLLYPDGSVQHAGVVILEIEGVNALLPRHAFIQQPSDPNFINVPMLFQAVTAACMMVRKSDFDRVNGFDESYWNGSEDVDLCFKLAEIGKKIVYQPKSVITHYESKSGKERHRGIRQNNKLLRERWANKIKPDIVIRGNQVREGISQKIQPYPKCDEFISVSRSQYINALISWVQKFFVGGNRLPARKFRFAIKTCTPTRNHLGWGDTPFAHSLGKAITKLGNSCEVHFKDEWNQADKHIDVVIHLRGVYPYTPKPNHLNIVWIINHPERQTIEEINQFDIVFCASRVYLERLKNEIKPPCFYLPQATDEEVFTPSQSGTTKDIDLLFVGNKYYNDKPRQIIQDVLATGKKYDLCVVGRRWHGFVNREYYKAEFVEWHKLPELYSRAKIVLNDHHETMSQFGFVNNRTFDLAALKAFQISNYVEGIEEFGIVTYKSPEDLRRKLDYFLQNEGEREEFADLSNELCKGYTFTNVARKILDVVNRFFNEKTSGKITGYKQHLTRAISRQDVHGEQSSEIESADTICAAPSGRAVPRVSIITACYNGAKFLPECLNSIRNQSMQEWELFLLDDGSTDGTRCIIEDYARRDARIKPFYFDDNKGPYVRRNFAIERANADFIVIHDADDIMCPDKLERLYEAITQDDRLGVVGSFYRMFLNEFRGIDHTDDVVLATTNDEILDGYTNHGICDFCPHGVAIIRKKLFEELGPYDENPFGSDSLWLAKVAEYASRTNEIRLKNIPRFLTLRRMHSHSQRGRLPCFDPRSRRTRYRQYCECKLRKITEKLRAFPDTDLKTELRNCVCSDFLERFRDHIIRWENEPLNKNVIPELLKNSVWLFNKKFYVNCVSMLNGIEVMAPDIANRFKNYDLLRAMALFALDMKERSRMFLNRELQNHRNTAAKQFISDYFEKRSNTEVQKWCAENADRYDLQMIDTETVAQTASQPI